MVVETVLEDRSEIARRLELDDETVDRLFHALADPTRRDIVVQAMRGEHSVSALARRYPMSVAAVQKHVAVLEQARLVTKERRGREQIVHSNIDAVRQASRLLDELEAIWRGRIDRIGELLAEPEAPRRAPRRAPKGQGDTR
jgi:DNA-binding transcriptional ArsR family regulator